MSNKITSPPAFPVESFQQQSNGMSKRYFTACMATQGILSNQLAAPTSNIHFKNIVEDAYKIADELIKQEFNTEE